VTDSRGDEHLGPAGQPRDPVLMLAPARSYSTVSLAMLAGHPQLYGFPEMLVFTAPTVGEVLKGVGRPAHAGWIEFGNIGISRAVAQIHEGSQSPAAVERALDWLRARSDWQSVALMNHLLRLVHPKTGLEKSPDTVRSETALNACLQAYPHSMYLHLTRHPVSTVQSMQKHWAMFFPREMSKQMRSSVCLMSWYTCHLRIVKALLDLPGDQWMRVRAEDLLREPRIWLPRVLDRLSLSHDNTTIEHMTQTDRWQFAQYNPGAEGGGDYSFMRNPALRQVPAPAAELDSPPWEITDEVRRRITVLARYLGY
jgi:Sulfotransferase family